MVTAVNLFVSDFGRVLMPDDIAAQLDRVPRRKVRTPSPDGGTMVLSQYDRRYKVGKAAISWERRQNLRLQALWVDGRESEFQLEPFEA